MSRLEEAASEVGAAVAPFVAPAASDLATPSEIGVVLDAVAEFKAVSGAGKLATDGDEVVPVVEAAGGMVAAPGGVVAAAGGRGVVVGAGTPFR